MTFMYHGCSDNIFCNITGSGICRKVSGTSNKGKQISYLLDKEFVFGNVNKVNVLCIGLLIRMQGAVLWTELSFHYVSSSSHTIKWLL